MRIMGRARKQPIEDVQSLLTQLATQNHKYAFCGLCTEGFLELCRAFYWQRLPSSPERGYKVGSISHALEHEHDCALCRFFVDTLQLRTSNNSYQIDDKDVTIFLMPDPDPWFVKAGIFVDMIACPYAWLRIGPETEEPLICISLEPISADGSLADLEPGKAHPRKRGKVEGYNGSCDFSIIQGWLEKCEKYHVECLQQQQKGDLPDGFMLIDVRTRCLERYKQGAQYLALSYVWGRGALEQRYWLENQSEFTTLYKEGCKLPDRLPKTIEDAILVVKKLQRKYLWIDLFCINQANELDKQDQIEAMDVIFASSWLTLVALDGPHADAGLGGISRAMTQTKQPVVQTPAGRLMATFVHSHWNHNGDSPWDCRAWTLQERLLSPRCLFFANTHYSMSCKEEYFHELVDINVKDPEVLLQEGHEYFREDGSSVNIDATKWNFDTYGNLVSVFTGRNLTDSNDVLNACRGSLNRIMLRTGYEFHFGLPKKDMLQALLWIPHYEHQVVRRPNFPSWSWLGWIGRTEYPYWLHFQNRGTRPTLKQDDVRRMDMAQSAFEKTNAMLDATIAHDATLMAPVIQLATVVRSYSVQCLFQNGQPFCPTPTRPQQEAIGDQWALVRDDDSLLVNPTGELQRFTCGTVSFRLDPEQSRAVIRKKNQVDLAFVKYWSYIWDVDALVLKHMVSCLLLLKDKEGCYHRLGCVVVPADEWCNGTRRTETITII